MSHITEAQLRSVIRAQIVRKLNEATGSDTAVVDSESAERAAAVVSDAIHKRELQRLKQADGDRSRPIAALEDDAKLVSVVGRHPRDGKPANLVIKGTGVAAARPLGRKKPVSVVRTRSKDYAGVTTSSSVYLFETEQELSDFLNDVLAGLNLKVGDLKLTRLYSDDKGGSTYGYVVSLAPL